MEKGISESIKPLQLDSFDRELFIIDPDSCKVIRLDEKGDFLGSFTTIDKYHHLCSPVRYHST